MIIIKLDKRYSIFCEFYDLFYIYDDALDVIS